mmetsp:Transcript_6020/g.19296  ORF Transcript_6020/g.19296 Transcript_6020/m.19296 type:complete len:377 (-) Transcript_6020:177-1307(-)
MRAVLAHGGLSVPAGVDYHVGVHAEDGLGGHGQLLGVVQLVVPRAPLPCQAARVLAARLRAVPSVEAIAVAVACVGLVRAERPQGLVVGNVCGKAAHLGHGQVHALQHPHEGHEVVLPAEPAAVGCVQVDGHLGRLGGELLDGVLDALRVGLPCGSPSATRVILVRREIRQTVRLDHNHHRHLARILLQHLDKRVRIGLLVFLETRVAVCLPRVVAPAVRLVLAANLAVGGLGMAVPVRQVVPDEHNHFGRRLGRGVREDALERLHGGPPDLRLDIDPIGGRYVSHLRKVLFDHTGAGGDGLIVRNLVGWVLVEDLAGKRVPHTRDVEGLQESVRPCSDGCVVVLLRWDALADERGDNKGRDERGTNQGGQHPVAL